MLAFRPEKYTVHTEVFDGPLELLLYLIRRDGIDVRDIPIAHVTREYLGYLELMEEMNLDVAGDFLLMAATLCQLKSRELLPRDPALDEDEEEDPKERLTRRILEYERYRRATEELESREWLGREVYAREPIPVSNNERPLDPGVDAFGLLEAFYAVLKSNAAEEPVHEIEMEEYTLSERVGWLLDRLSGGEVLLTEVFEDIWGRSQRLLTFLALLEMAKLQMVDIVQGVHLGAVQLSLKVAADEVDLSAIPQEA